MSAKQDPAANDPNLDESVESTLLSTPDEAGPHDVSDDEVIEKTLPTAPAH
jgi:hypothetical protein